MSLLTPRLCGAIFTILSLIGLTACETAVEPSYYVLEPATEATERAAVQGNTLIGLRELALPLYVRRTQIAAVGQGGAITLSDNHRWAEDSPRAMTRVVARALSATSGSMVVVEPWPLSTRPRLRIDIEVDYFAGRLGGDLRLEGQYRIVPEGGNAVTRTFSLAEPSRGDGYDDLVDRHRRALGALAARIAADL